MEYLLNGHNTRADGLREGSCRAQGGGVSPMRSVDPRRRRRGKILNRLGELYGEQKLSSKYRWKMVSEDREDDPCGLSPRPHRAPFKVGTCQLVTLVTLWICRSYVSFSPWGRRFRLYSSHTNREMPDFRSSLLLFANDLWL